MSDGLRKFLDTLGVVSIILLLTGAVGVITMVDTLYRSITTALIVDRIFGVR